MRNQINIEQRILLLNSIFRKFRLIKQWTPSDIVIASKYAIQAESIIEILEIDDCGSVGGFDKENPIKTISGYRLYDRFLALVAKYNNENDVRGEVFHISLEKLGLYFKTLNSFNYNNMNPFIDIFPSEQEIDNEAECRYPVKKQMYPNNSPYEQSKLSFIHGVNWALSFIEKNKF